MFYLRTFGGLKLENGDLPPNGAATQRSRLALLAVLAAAGDRGVSRESLQALFWPDSDTETARGALNQALYALRRDLGKQDLTTGSADLVLNPSVIQSDVQEFTPALERGELERAVALYRGKFLEGVHINGGEFDRWLDRQRQQLHELYQDALGRLARAAESRSDYPEAVRWWRAAAAADPLSAIAACALMRALVRNGDGAAALRHARIYEDLVKSELDAPPDKSVVDLAVEINSGVGSPHPSGGADTTPLVAPIALQTGALRSEKADGRIVRKRNWLGAGIALAALGTVIWALAVDVGRKRLDPDRVVLITGSRSSAAVALDSVLFAELSSGLPDRDPALSVSLPPPGSRTPNGTRVDAIAAARAARARYVIEVSSALQGDSVRFSAIVTDAASETKLGLVGPIVVPRDAPGPGARALRDRIAVSLAAHRNPLFANWAYAAALPYSWESFEEMALGIQEVTTEESSWDRWLSLVRLHFRAAAALDSTSGAPLLWEAFVMYWNSATESDSILTVAERSARRFGPWERALAALLKVRNQGELPGAHPGGHRFYDLPGAHAAGHRLLDVVPGSEWALLVAQDALQLGRARETVELAEAVSRNPGWTKDWWLGGWIRGIAYHLLGEYQRELELSRETLRRSPDSRIALQLEVKPLAGLGRVSQVRVICERAMSLRRDWEGGEYTLCYQAITELASHGHPEAARSLTERLLPSREAAESTARGRAMVRARSYETLADWEEVGKALRGVPTAETGDQGYQWLLVKVQAFHRDRPGVEQTLRWLDSVNAKNGYPESPGAWSAGLAEVAALLGDRDRAVDLLAKALQEGFGRIPLHWAGGFDGLRGDPRFDALARPVEDAAHLAQLRRDWRQSRPATLSLLASDDREAARRRR